MEVVFPPYKKLICNISSISFLLIFESLCIFSYSDNQLTCWPAMQFYCAALLDIRCRLYLCAVLWFKWRVPTGDKTLHLHWTFSHLTSLYLRAKWKNSSQSYWHKASVAHVMNRTIHMCPEPNGTDFFSGAVSSLLGTAWPCNRPNGLFPGAKKASETDSLLLCAVLHVWKGNFSQCQDLMLCILSKVHIWKWLPSSATTL